MQKLFIKNRKDQNICVLVDETKNQKGLAFVMHGLSGYKEEPHIIVFAEAFKEKGFTVVRFDTTNTFGESDGKYEDATATNYYEDLEDVITWAHGQPWYQEPFVLAGHSFGGLCVTLFAEKYPEKVLALAPISTVISGHLSMQTKKYSKEMVGEWRRTGWFEEKSVSRPSDIKRLPWSHMEDRLKYDTLPQAIKLTMPVLMIVGELDTSTPPEQQKMLYDTLLGKKEFHIIKNSHHVFQGEEHLREIKDLFLQWIDNLLKT